MSSFFDEASLVFIPSGYKTSKAYSIKPTDGSGDMSFSRSNDTASRIAPNGLIEKVRTNRLLQSNTFSTTWTNNNSTETSGQAGYDGTNNAWFLTAAGTSSAFVEQSIVFTGLSNYSVYLKKGTSSFAALTIEGTGGGFSYFNLNTGQLGTASGVTASIQSVGNGWYRCSVSASPSAGSGVRVYVTDADNSTNVTNGNNILIQAAQLESGDIATQPISTTTAAVSVGPVANVPRLDYLNSSCPRLLLEPQRTNIAIYSEQFDNPSGWTLYNGTQVANTTETLDPSGYYGAEKVTMGGTNSATYRKTIGGLTNGDTYTFSLYIKQGSGVTAFLDICDASTTPDITPTSSWVRYTKTGVWNTTLNFVDIELRGTSGSYCYIWGAQLELGAYATSYIPTLGAAVTRGRDDCAKTGISSLIGQTAGTVFVEFEFSGSKDAFWPVITIMGASSAELIEIYGSAGSNGVGVFMLDNGVTQFSQSRTISVGRHKLAIAYELNNTVAYLDGTIMGTVDTSCTIPTMTQIGVGEFAYSSAYTFGDRIDQAILFPVRLSNSDLAALTA